ncbi:hypothetical protein Emag_000733 [Eimeria magna]
MLSGGSLSSEEWEGAPLAQIDLSAAAVDGAPVAFASSEKRKAETSLGVVASVSLRSPSRDSGVSERPPTSRSAGNRLRGAPSMTHPSEGPSGEAPRLVASAATPSQLRDSERAPACCSPAPGGASVGGQCEAPSAFTPQLRGPPAGRLAASSRSGAASLPPRGARVSSFSRSAARAFFRSVADAGTPRSRSSSARVPLPTAAAATTATTAATPAAAVAGTPQGDSEQQEGHPQWMGAPVEFLPSSPSESQSPYTPLSCSSYSSAPSSQATAAAAASAAASAASAAAAAARTEEALTGWETPSPSPVGCSWAAETSEGPLPNLGPSIDSLGRCSESDFHEEHQQQLLLHAGVQTPAFGGTLSHEGTPPLQQLRAAVNLLIEPEAAAAADRSPSSAAAATPIAAGGIAEASPVSPHKPRSPAAGATAPAATAAAPALPATTPAGANAAAAPQAASFAAAEDATRAGASVCLGTASSPLTEADSAANSASNSAAASAAASAAVTPHKNEGRTTTVEGKDARASTCATPLMSPLSKEQAPQTHQQQQQEQQRQQHKPQISGAHQTHENQCQPLDLHGGQQHDHADEQQQQQQQLPLNYQELQQHGQRHHVESQLNADGQEQQEHSQGRQKEVQQQHQEQHSEYQDESQQQQQEELEETHVQERPQQHEKALLSEQQAEEHSYCKQQQQQEQQQPHHHQLQQPEQSDEQHSRRLHHEEEQQEKDQQQQQQLLIVCEKAPQQQQQQQHAAAQATAAAPRRAFMRAPWRPTGRRSQSASSLSQPQQQQQQQQAVRPRLAAGATPLKTATALRSTASARTPAARFSADVQRARGNTPQATASAAAGAAAGDRGPFTRRPPLQGQPPPRVRRVFGKHHENCYSSLTAEAAAAGEAAAARRAAAVAAARAADAAPQCSSGKADGGMVDKSAAAATTTAAKLDAEATAVEASQTAAALADDLQARASTVIRGSPAASPSAVAATVPAASTREPVAVKLADSGIHCGSTNAEQQQQQKEQEQQEQQQEQQQLQQQQEQQEEPQLQQEQPMSVDEEHRAASTPKGSSPAATPALTPAAAAAEDAADSLQTADTRPHSPERGFESAGGAACVAAAAGVSALLQAACTPECAAASATAAATATTAATAAGAPSLSWAPQSSPWAIDNPSAQGRCFKADETATATAAKSARKRSFDVRTPQDADDRLHSTKRPRGDSQEAPVTGQAAAAGAATGAAATAAAAAGDLEATRSTFLLAEQHSPGCTVEAASSIATAAPARAAAPLTPPQISEEIQKDFLDHEEHLQGSSSNSNDNSSSSSKESSSYSLYEFKENILDEPSLFADEAETAEKEDDVRSPADCSATVHRRLCNRGCCCCSPLPAVAAAAADGAAASATMRLLRCMRPQLRTFLRQQGHQQQRAVAAAHIKGFLSPSVCLAVAGIQQQQRREQEQQQEQQQGQQQQTVGARCLAATVALLQIASLPSPTTAKASAAEAAAPRGGFRCGAGGDTESALRLLQQAANHPYLSLAAACCSKGKTADALNLLRGLYLVELKLYTDHQQQQQQQQQQQIMYELSLLEQQNEGAQHLSPPSLLLLVCCSILCCNLLSSNDSRSSGSSVERKKAEAATAIFEEFCIEPLLLLLLQQQLLQRLERALAPQASEGDLLRALQQVLRALPPPLSLTSCPFCCPLQQQQQLQQDSGKAVPGLSLASLLLRAASLYLLESSRAQHQLQQQQLLRMQLLLCGLWANASGAPKGPNTRPPQLRMAADAALAVLIGRFGGP